MTAEFTIFATDLTLEWKMNTTKRVLVLEIENQQQCTMVRRREHKAGR